jgi:hypothetical protein
MLRQVGRAGRHMGRYIHNNSYTGQMPSLPLGVRNSKGKTSRDVEQRGLG